jgi:aspartate aminotransferase
MVHPISLAARVDRVKPSFTLEMTSKAAELNAQGIDIVNFSVGEPDFNTPENIRTAAKKAMDDGFTKYTSGAGMIDLREAICKKLKRENNLEYSPSQILVSNGEKQSLYLACQALFQAGDQVIVFSPYWVSFPEFVTLSDAEPVIVSTNPDKQFEPNFDDLELKINDRIKGVILNSPSNPTGGVWSNEAVDKLLKIASENGWVVISDECYERLIFEGDFTSTQTLNKYDAEVLTCMSVSKTYAMTGWRIGYSAGNETIIKAMSKIQGQATSCANSIGQKAATEALNGDQSAVVEMRETFRRRRDLILGLLKNVPHVICIEPKGAFYVFPDFSHYLGMKTDLTSIRDSFDLSDYLLDTARVVTVPGDGFGAPGHIRLSFATDSNTIKDGMERIKTALQKLN